MPPDHDDAAYVFDMLRHARIVRTLVLGRTFEQFCADVQFRFAVERAIEIIGMAAREVTKEFENAHPEIPWHKIVSQRHVLAHQYGDIDPEKIWRVATIHVPAMIEQLIPLLPPAPPDIEPEA